MRVLNSKVVWLLLFLISLSIPLKAQSFEVSPGIVFYTGDSLRSSFLGGASLCYHFNRNFWVGADVMSGQASVDRNSAVGIQKDDKLFSLNGAVYWNIAALLDDTLTSDFYTSLGMGNIWIGTQREIFGFVGGGLTLHSGWNGLSLRFDLKNLFFMLRNSQGDDFNSDMALTLGPSWIF